MNGIWAVTRKEAREIRRDPITLGVALALPVVMLFLFAYGARALPYSTVGVLQYIAPTLQLLCGVVLFHESFPPARAAGFALLWLALLIYAADGLWRARSAARAATA